MDPLTAFGLSANVFQVVNFSIQIVSHGYQIYKSADGMLGELSDVEKLATDLSNCNTLLLAYLHRIGPEQQLPSSQGNSITTIVSEDKPPVRSSRFGDADEQALAEVCRDCNRIANTLLFKLEKVRVKPGSKKNEWKAASKAFRAAWEQSDIESINSRLRQYREQLNTRLLLSVRERLDRSVQQHDGRLETLEGKARNILAALMQNRDESAMDMSVLATRFKQLSQLIMTEHEKTRNVLQVSHASTFAMVASPQDNLRISLSRGNTPSPSPAVSIHEVVTSGTMQQVRKLLRNPRQHIDEVDEAGCSALHLACLNQRFDVAHHLVLKGAEINEDDDTGSTPLHYVVKGGDAAFVRLLLQRYASQDFKDNDGRKPFFYANSDNFLLNWLKKFGHNVDAIDPATGYTALIQAAKKGDVHSVEAMVEQGANMDVQCPTKNTALHYACNLGNLEIIKHLVDKECGLEFQNETKCTPLMVAARKGNISAVKILVSAGANLETSGADENFTPLLAAIHDKHAEIACYLISQGAALDVRDKHGYTPMHRAAQAGLMEITRILVDRGCDMNELGSNTGYSVISEAAVNNFPGIVDYLARNGANLETRDTNDNQPLQLASMNGRTECVRSLLAHGANPNIQNCFGYTPMHDSAERGYDEILKLLLEAGAEKETRMIEENGYYTALQFASMHGKIDCVRVLLKYGADIDSGNRHGWTPLMEACYYGHVEIAEMLIEAGANVEIRDISGLGPMDNAVNQGQKECIKLLKQY